MKKEADKVDQDSNFRNLVKTLTHSSASHHYKLAFIFKKLYKSNHIVYILFHLASFTDEHDILRCTHVVACITSEFLFAE